eukprot:gene7455-184_t
MRPCTRPGYRLVPWLSLPCDLCCPSIDVAALPSTPAVPRAVHPRTPPHASPGSLPPFAYVPNPASPDHPCLSPPEPGRFPALSSLPAPGARSRALPCAGIRRQPLHPSRNHVLFITTRVPTPASGRPLLAAASVMIQSASILGLSRGCAARALHRHALPGVDLVSLMSYSTTTHSGTPDAPLPPAAPPTALRFPAKESDGNADSASQPPDGSGAPHEAGGRLPPYCSTDIKYEYLSDDGTAQGPYPLSALVSWVSDGFLAQDVQVRQQGSDGNWAALSAVHSKSLLRSSSSAEADPGSKTPVEMTPTNIAAAIQSLTAADQSPMQNTIFQSLQEQRSGPVLADSLSGPQTQPNLAGPQNPAQTQQPNTVFMGAQGQQTLPPQQQGPSQSSQSQSQAHQQSQSQSQSQPQPKSKPKPEQPEEEMFWSYQNAPAPGARTPQDSPCMLFLAISLPMPALLMVARDQLGLRCTSPIHTRISITHISTTNSISTLRARTMVTRVCLIISFTGTSISKSLRPTFPTIFFISITIKCWPTTMPSSSINSTASASTPASESTSTPPSARPTQQGQNAPSSGAEPASPPALDNLLQQLVPGAPAPPPPPAPADDPASTELLSMLLQGKSQWKAPQPQLLSFPLPTEYKPAGPIDHSQLEQQLFKRSPAPAASKAASGPVPAPAPAPPPAPAPAASSAPPAPAAPTPAGKATRTAQPSPASQPSAKQSQRQPGASKKDKAPPAPVPAQSDNTANQPQSRNKKSANADPWASKAPVTALEHIMAQQREDTEQQQLLDLLQGSGCIPTPSHPPRSDRDNSKRGPRNPALQDPPTAMDPPQQNPWGKTAKAAPPKIPTLQQIQREQQKEKVKEPPPEPKHKIAQPSPEPSPPPVATPPVNNSSSSGAAWGAWGLNASRAAAGRQEQQSGGDFPELPSASSGASKRAKKKAAAANAAKSSAARAAEQLAQAQASAASPPADDYPALGQSGPALAQPANKGSKKGNKK